MKALNRAVVAAVALAAPLFIATAPSEAAASGYCKNDGMGLAVRTA